MRENPKASRASASGERSLRQRQERTEQRQTSTRMSGHNRREGWLIPLCIILPPVGAAYMWAMQRYSMRVRVLISLLSACILFLESYLIFSGSAGMPDSTIFTPGAGSVYAPVSVTAEPTQVPEATDLPYDYVEAATQSPDNTDGNTSAVDPGAFIPNTNSPESTANAAENTVAGDTATTGSYDTVVYTADGSLFYHSSANCGGKEYPTTMTLQDALNAGLAPCNNCNPPSSVG